MGYYSRWADPLIGNLAIADRLTLDTSSGPFYSLLDLFSIYSMLQKTSRTRTKK